MINKQAFYRRHKDAKLPVIGVGIDPDTRHPAAALVIRWAGGGTAMVKVDVLKTPRDDLKDEEKIVQTCLRVKPWLDEFFAPSVIQRIFEEPHQLSVAVEGQKIYKQSKADPADILGLAQTAGAALAYPWGAGAIVLRPVPSVWKGETSKETNQGRTYLRLGMKCRVKRTAKESWCVPTIEAGSPWQFTEGEWCDIGDALGLAVWACETTAART